MKAERSYGFIYKPLFSSEISFKKGVINVQRSALGEGGESLNVKLQANGRRKILTSLIRG